MRRLAIIIVIFFSASPAMLLAEPEIVQSNTGEAVSTKGSPLLRGEPRVDLMFSIPLEYTAGVEFGTYYDLRADLYMNRYSNFFMNFRLGPDIPELDNFSTGWDMAPLPFLKLGLRYLLGYYPDYKIIEHNAALITAFFAKNTSTPHWFDFEFLLGTDFRFIDLDINNSSSVYRRDWMFEWFLLYRFDFLFYPLEWLSTGFSFGNYNESVYFSSNYLQVEFRMIFKLPKRVSLVIKGGFAFSAFLLNPGYINKGWGETGVKYEIPFK